MQGRRAVTDPGDGLAARDNVAAPDQNHVGVFIGRCPVIPVTNENEIAVALQIVAGVRDRSSFRCPHRAVPGHSDVHLIGILAEPHNDPACRGPSESGRVRRPATSEFAAACAEAVRPASAATGLRTNSDRSWAGAATGAASDAPEASAVTRPNLII